MCLAWLVVIYQTLSFVMPQYFCFAQTVFDLINTRDRENYMLSFILYVWNGLFVKLFFFICYFCKFTEKYWCANSSSVLVLFMNKKVLKEERVCLSCSTQFSVESCRSFSLWNFTYKVRLTNGSVRPMTLTGEK